jgi:thiamine biosynthesis lipoprotein
MGTGFTLLCSGSAGSQRRLQRAERWLQAFEGRFSRFLPGSELSRLNASAGRPFRASPALFEFVRQCLDLADRSGGLFDPTLLHELEAAGYDRTFDEVLHGRSGAVRTGVTFRDVVLDDGSRTIVLPRGTGIDSGGLGKGWAADRASMLLGEPCLVDLGGDIYARGRPPDADCWRIGVQDPFQPDRDLTVLGVRDMGVATSSTLKRRWPAESDFAHHLLDPRSGRPSESDAVAVTAIAPSAAMADFYAKVALLKGSSLGLSYLESEPDVEGLIVRADGAILMTSGLEKYVAGGLAPWPPILGGEAPERP